MKVTWCWLVCLCLVAAGHQVSSAADKKKAAVKSSSPENEQEKVEAVIEDVNAKQLERLLDEKDYVAVYWCKNLFHFLPQVGCIVFQIFCHLSYMPDSHYIRA